MKYVLDISCLDKYSSGAKQRFLSLYTELIKINKNKIFLIIYTDFTNNLPLFLYKSKIKKNKSN